MADTPPQIVETQHTQDAARILELEERIRQDYSRYTQYEQNVKKHISQLETDIQQDKLMYERYIQDTQERISELETDVQQYEDQEERAEKTGWRSDEELIRKNAGLERSVVNHIEHIAQLYAQFGDDPNYVNGPRKGMKDPPKFKTKEDILVEFRSRTTLLIMTSNILDHHNEQFNKILEAIVKVVSAKEVGDGEMQKALLGIFDTPPFSYRFTRKRARSE